MDASKGWHHVNPKPCQTCGKIIPSPRERTLYCSRACCPPSRKSTSVERPCQRCGKPFRKPPSMNQKYCSRACWIPNRSAIGKCPACGKEFPYFLSTPRKYCSWACANKSTAEVRFEGHRFTLVCETCGKEFTRSKFATEYTTHHFCSQPCFGKWLSATKVGTDNPRYKGKIERTCQRCGKTFLAYPAWIAKGEGIYCSKACCRNRISLTCPICNKTFTTPAGEAEHRRCCSKTCYGQWMSQTQRGEAHPNWKGGYISYYGPNWYSQRRNARRRDGYKCRECGKTEVELGKHLDVHHIKTFREFGIERYLEANRLANLISLCASCHKYVENGRELSSEQNQSS